NPQSLVPSVSGAVEVLAVVLLLLILASSLDDAWIDARYWLRRLRRPRGFPARPEASARSLRQLPELPMAVMVPAWHESDVIAAMLENAIHRLEYADYMLFVGTYPNDPRTIAEVERVAARNPRVRRVQIDHSGPTCKADCLNAIVADILAVERATGREFYGVVMHDSEDVLHPLELRYFNAVLSHHDMVQIPVVALARDLRHLVAGTYMDEFAESHAKEMLVREELCGSIPSAGVGTCFSRPAIRALWESSGGNPFRTDSLTEDYEIGMRLAELGMRSRFALVSIVEDDNAPGAPETPADTLLSVREFFPASFRAAYRQKARWILGIGLQSWRQVPLRGRPVPVTYMMLHDRKGIVTAFVPPAAYLVMAYMLLLAWGSAAQWWPPGAGGLFREGSFWNALLYVNGALLAVRCAQRAYFTSSIYGWRQGLAALPRMVVGNFVNCMAAARAWRLFLAHCLTGRPLAWDKTAHQFPDLPLPKPALQPLPQSGLGAATLSHP
ncbi:MAG TPA: glycosyl transferase family protein, partial [Ramlibacter sp.]